MNRLNKVSYISVAILLGLTSALSYAGTVTVITSFSKEITQVYKTAFEKANPTIKLEILNKNTIQGISYVRELPAGQRPEIFWASAPDAFEVLAGQNLLLNVSEQVNKSVPAKVGNYPINNPQGLYLGQALSGYGLMWNTRYLGANKIPAPAQWADLTKPVYFNHVAISSPSRSGTTHLTVETILQGEGWDKGWSQLLQIAGNSAAITERSFGVPDGVNNGQFGVGLVVDFFALGSKAGGFPVDFAYPTLTAIVPANIGLISGSKNAEEAKKFIAFSISLEGQSLLLDPKISRLPVLPLSDFANKVPAGYPNAFDIAKRAKVNFNSDLSEDRYNVVSSMFDQTITFRHKDLQAATKAIHEASAALAKKPSPQGQALLKQAQDLAFTPILTSSLVGNKNFLALFATSKKDAAANKEISGLEDRWNVQAKDHYAKAKIFAEQALALAK